jgi:hypothetical protein
VGPYSNRVTLAVESKDDKGLTEALRKLFVNDPDARSRKIGGVVVWELPPREKKSKKATAAKRPTQALAVAHGHLLLASHTQFLEKLLTHADKTDKGFAATTDQQRIAKALEGLEVPGPWLRFTGRPDVNLQPVYEMARRKELRRDRSMLAGALQQLLGDRLDAIDFSKLLDFEQVSRRLGPSGLVAAHQADGWLFVGVVLKKNAP